MKNLTSFLPILSAALFVLDLPSATGITAQENDDISVVSAPAPSFDVPGQR